MQKESAMIRKGMFAVMIWVLMAVMMTTPQVHAGGNGQKITVTDGVHFQKMHRVTVSGHNHNDAQADWDSAWATRCDDDGGCDRISTDGWWWKGYVDITIYYEDGNDGPDISCEVFVPEDQWMDDWTRVEFYDYWSGGSHYTGCWLDDGWE